MRKLLESRKTYRRWRWSRSGQLPQGPAWTVRVRLCMQGEKRFALTFMFFHHIFLFNLTAFFSKRCAPSLNASKLVRNKDNEINLFYLQDRQASDLAPGPFPRCFAWFQQPSPSQHTNEFQKQSCSSGRYWTNLIHLLLRLHELVISGLPFRGPKNDKHQPCESMTMQETDIFVFHNGLTQLARQLGPKFVYGPYGVLRSLYTLRLSLHVVRRQLLLIARLTHFKWPQFESFNYCFWLKCERGSIQGAHH